MVFDSLQLLSLTWQGPYRPYAGVGKQSFKNSTSEPKQQRSFWSILAKKAKSALLDDGLSTCSTSDSGLGQDKNCETSQMQVWWFVMFLSFFEQQQLCSQHMNSVKYIALQCGIQYYVDSVRRFSLRSRVSVCCVSVTHLQRFITWLKQ